MKTTVPQPSFDDAIIKGIDNRLRHRIRATLLKQALEEYEEKVLPLIENAIDQIGPLEIESLRNLVEAKEYHDVIFRLNGEEV